MKLIEKDGKGGHRLKFSVWLGILIMEIVILIYSNFFSGENISTLFKINNILFYIGGFIMGLIAKESFSDLKKKKIE